MRKSDWYANCRRSFWLSQQNSVDGELVCWDPPVATGEATHLATSETHTTPFGLLSEHLTTRVIGLLLERSFLYASSGL
jgi:hypothetical protein